MVTWKKKKTEARGESSEELNREKKEREFALN